MYKKQYGFREFKRLLRENGYELVRTSGSHYIFENRDSKTITVPLNLNRMIEFRLIKEYELIDPRAVKSERKKNREHMMRSSVARVTR